MKLWIKIICIVFSIFILFILCLHIVINVKGKSLLVDKLEETFKKEVSAGTVRMLFPFDLIIRDLEVRDLFKIDEVFARGGAIDIFRRRFILSELKITRAVVNIERLLSTIVEDTLLTERTKKTPLSTPDISPTVLHKGGFLFPNFSLGRLIVNDSTCNFIDKSIKDKTIIITVKDLNINAKNLNFPIKESRITSFQLNGKIPWREGANEGTVHASGWFNLYKKDIQAILEIQNIDGVYLYPYYSKWVDLENARIKEAKLDFTGNIKGENNDVTAECRLELTDIKFRPRPPDQPEHKAEKITTAVLGIFRALSQGRVVLDFTVKTTMDRPQFKFESISSAVDSKLSQAVKTNKVKVEDLAVLPDKFIEALTKGTAGTTKALIEGVVTVGKSVTDALLDALKFPSEKKEERGVEKEEETEATIP